MIKKRGIIKYFAAVILVNCLAGCGYRAKLLNTGTLNANTPVAVVASVNNVGEQKTAKSRLLMLCKPAPGLISGGIAFNPDFRKGYCQSFLLSSLDFNSCTRYFTNRIYSEFPQADIEAYQQQNATVNAQNTDIVGEQNSSIKEYYKLELEINYDICDKTNQPAATLNGRLTRASDGELLWKNRIQYQSSTSLNYADLLSGKADGAALNAHFSELQRIFSQTNENLAQLLISELTDPASAKLYLPVKAFRTKDDELIKAQIIEQTTSRVLLRTVRGQLRSMPKNALLCELRPVFSLL